MNWTNLAVGLVGFYAVFGNHRGLSTPSTLLDIMILISVAVVIDQYIEGRNSK